MMPIWGNPYKYGVMDGVVKPGDTIQLMSNGKTFDATEVGIFYATAIGRDFLATGMSAISLPLSRRYRIPEVGDTVTLADNPATEPLHGYKLDEPDGFRWTLSDRV